MLHVPLIVDVNVETETLDNLKSISAYCLLIYDYI